MNRAASPASLAAWAGPVRGNVATPLFWPALAPWPAPLAPLPPVASPLPLPAPDPDAEDEPDDPGEDRPGDAGELLAPVDGDAVEE